ncbi:MAG: Wzz/FepE/Etk N-terminal domain-containing protein [Elusimicrobiota bacterium]
MENQDEFNWEVRDLAKIAFKRWWVPLPVTAICLLVAVTVMMFWTPVYTGTVRLLVSGTAKTDSPLYSPVPAGRMMSIALSHAEMIKSQDILQTVVVDLGLHKRKNELYFSAPKRWVLRGLDWGLDLYEQAGQFVMASILNLPPSEGRRKDIVMQAVEALEKRVVTEAVDKTDVLTVKVKDYDPEMAARIGNLMAQRYTVFVMKQQAADLATQYGPKHPLTMQLMEDIARQELHIVAGKPALALSTGVGTIKIVQTAHAATKPSQPKRRPILLVSLIGGLLGGVILMFILERFDPTFQGLESLRRGLPFPVIGVVPKKIWRKSGALKGNTHDRIDLDPFMGLAYQIDSLRRRAGAKILCLSAAEETRSTVRLAQMLALCLSRIEEERDPSKDGRVLLVEAQQSGSHFLQSRGDAKDGALIAVKSLEESAEPHAAVQRIDDHLSVAVLSKAGRSSSAISLGERKCRDFLRNASEKFGTVLIGGSGLSHRPDALMLNALCDSTIVIINDEMTRKKALAGLLAMLEINKITVLGAILNDQRHHLPGPLYRIF